MVAAERVGTPTESADVCFDVVVGDDQGPVLEWSGLMLRRVGDLAGQYADRLLLGAHLARRIRELGWSLQFDATVSAATDPAAEAAAMLGAGSVRHSPAGLLESDKGFVSTSTSDAHRITVWSQNRRVGTDWATVRRGDHQPVLRAEDAALAGRLAAGLPSTVIVWAAREAALKAGCPYDAELVAAAAEDDHSAVFRIAGGDVLVEVIANEAVSEVLAVFVGAHPAGEELR
jgi:hypothetical protein